MKKEDREYFEERLLEERARVLKKIGQYDESIQASSDADAEDSAYSFHMADKGTDAMEREKAFLFASKEGRLLYHIDEALRRLYRTPEQFGVCQECDEDIVHERLDALPHARLCIRCKEEEESGARG